MVYNELNFWNEIGAKFIFSFTRNEGCDMQEDEILPILLDKSYLDDQKSKDIDPLVVGMAKAWDKTHALISEAKDKMLAGEDGPFMDMTKFKDVYIALDPTLEYLELFENRESYTFVDQLEYLKNQLFKVTDLRENIEVLFQFTLKAVGEEALGELTFKFCSYVANAILIFKNHSPVISDRKDVNEEFMKLFMKLSVECAKTMPHEWNKLETYKKLCDLCVSLSEEFLLYHPEYYAN
ncbi:hypothetical protein SCHIN_v1c08590 [Spiroplasma chinense]|uniref:Uncharacterized protein n=1 Tax=Spiroplasma chinense TaxID=216932 RepID=A0A5B9Y4P1_9MOLU|nr:hypothetical protein [Spiroplasma chinense]QEH62054.1 hypothetical protein SCHIN_v1c08590 [Spiroplasma chinense]